MATVEVKAPSILVLEFWQEKKDEDYGTCLWARFYFDKENYSLSIESDCGTYGYSWTPTPCAESFLKLMSRLDEGYLLDKLSSRNQVDKEKTFENIKELIANSYCFYDVDFSEVMECNGISEYDLDQIKSACNAGDDRNVAKSLMSTLEDINDELDVEEYDVYQAIELGYPCSAKKIASVFIDFIQPKIKEIVNIESEVVADV